MADMARADDSAEPRPSGMRNSSSYFLTVAAVVLGLSWADRAILSIVFPQLHTELGLSDTQLGILGGPAFGIVFALAAIPFGRATDRRHRPRIMALGLVIWSLAVVATGLGQPLLALAGAGGTLAAFLVIFGARLFTGFGEASAFPASMSLISERFTAGARGRATGIYLTSVAVGSGLGATLAGVLAQRFGWQAMFVAFGAVGLVVLPFVLSLPDRARARRAQSLASSAAAQGTTESAREALGALIRDGRYLALLLCMVLLLTAATGYAAWVPTYLNRYWHLSVAQAASVAGLGLLVGGILGALGSGALADRRRRKAGAGRQLDVSAVAALLSVPLIALFLFGPTLASVIAASALASITLNAFSPSVQVVIAEIVPPARQGVAFAAGVALQAAVASSLGPFLIGVVSDLTRDLRVALYLPMVELVLAIFAALLAMALVRRSTRHAAEVPVAAAR